MLLMSRLDLCAVVSLSITQYSYLYNFTDMKLCAIIEENKRNLSCISTLGTFTISAKLIITKVNSQIKTIFLHRYMLGLLSKT